MSACDVIIRDGLVVTRNDVLAVDVGISDGMICLLEAGSSATANKIIDARGLHVFPGLIDSHVHFNEPGRSHWEGFETGTRALAAGGGTMFFDMPLNSNPPTTSVEGFDLKLAAAQKSSLVDFGLWGGLVPGNSEQLEPLSNRGAVGFKAFMSNSGIEEFPCIDERSLKAGMKSAQTLGKIVAVHAESENTTRELTYKMRAEGKTGIRDFLASRPIEAELEAITRAIEFAGETGCALHIVHVSCGAGIALVASARKLGVNVTCETCPHYLTLTEEDLEQIGALAKCAPPLRPTSARETLWSYLKQEEIFTIGSDHSPAPPEMKMSSNFFDIWGGISGVQHTLPLLISEGYVKRSVALELLARTFASNPAQRFGLPATKGEIRIGADADLALVDCGATTEVRPEKLFYRHAQSPYTGRTLTGHVVHTMLRGQTIFEQGAIVAAPMGRLVRPGAAG